jgi:hypothetical protein
MREMREMHVMRVMMRDFFVISRSTMRDHK